MIPNTLKAAVAAVAVLSGGGVLASASDAEAQSRGYGGYGNEQRLYDAEMRVVNANYSRNISRCSFFQRGCQAGARSIQAREAFELNARYGIATPAQAEQAYSLRIRAIELQRQERLTECWQRRDYRQITQCQASTERRAASDFRSAENWLPSALRRAGNSAGN